MLIPTVATQLVNSIENKLSLSFEQLLNLPGNVFWKNFEGIYLGYNDFGARMLGLNEGKELVGKNDFEIFNKQMACIYSKNDKIAMLQNNQICFSEKGYIQKHIPVIFLSYKIPIFSKENVPLGIFGISYTQLQKEIKFEIPKQSDLPNNLHLSEREQICASLLCQGLTVKLIAKKLGISFRTVETYLERVKEKLDCHNKAELIAEFLKNTQ
jgi:DNA-binding CsgD family transcriptional regulator